MFADDTSAKLLEATAYTKASLPKISLGMRIKNRVGSKISTS